MEDKNRSPFNHLKPDFGDEKLNEIWNVAESARPGQTLESDEVDHALQKVNSRIDKEMKAGTVRPLHMHFRNKGRYLVAAMALIVFGVYYFFIPVTVNVPLGEMAVIDLPDGSEVELNSGTTLSYNRLFGQTNRDISLNGEAYFSVRTKETPFTVEANGTVTEVTGTRFNLRSWKDDPFSQTTITVTDGSVDFYTINSSEAKVNLTPGSRSRWNSQMAAPSEPSPVSVSDIIGWRENRLIFKDQPLGVILNELERRFNTRIVLEIPEAEQETLTAYYTEPGNVHTVLEDISTVKGFRYTETSNGFRIFK